MEEHHQCLVSSRAARLCHQEHRALYLNSLKFGFERLRLRDAPDRIREICATLQVVLGFALERLK